MLKYLGPVVICFLSLLPEYQVGSLDELRDLPVDHALFGGPIHTEAHFDFGHYPSSLTQAQRTQSIRETVIASARAVREVGFPAFIESGTLIGLFRDGDVIPWDVDGDIGYYVPDCLRLFPEDGSLAKALSKALSGGRFVLKQGSVMQCDPVGATGTVNGQIVDMRTGVFVDIFFYKDIPELEPWQKLQSEEWLMRVNDENHGRFKFPKNVLFPLQETVFLGETVLVPADINTFLQYEYGSVLEPPLFPFTLMLYTQASLATLLLALIAIAVSGEYVLFAICASANFYVRGGLRDLLVAWSVLASFRTRVRWSTTLSIVAIGSLSTDLLPWLVQLMAVVADATNLYGTNVNLSRVRTLCLPGTSLCIDF